MQKLKLTTILITLLIASLSLADQAQAHELRCREILTNGLSSNSKTFEMSYDLLDIDYGRDYLARAVRLVRLLLESEGCQKKDINFGKGPNGRSNSRCVSIVANRDNSRVCYVESNLGYFILSQDMHDSVTITFNLWD